MRLPSATTIRRSTSNYRVRRMAMFLALFQPDPDEPILDVGGNPEMWLEVGYRGQVVVLNVDQPSDWPDLPAGFRYLQGDGCDLPFAPGEFPIVFSNSVIEHVGDSQAQQRFAAEVMRVGRRYWVQTPNRRFPIEPHMNFPAFQWLPDPVARVVVASWPLSHHRREGLTTDEACEAIRATRLLSVADMRQLFPAATMWRERAFGLTKSIVAYSA